MKWDLRIRCDGWSAWRLGISETSWLDFADNFRIRCFLLSRLGAMRANIASMSTGVEAMVADRILSAS